MTARLLARFLAIARYLSQEELLESLKKTFEFETGVVD